MIWSSREQYRKSHILCKLIITLTKILLEKAEYPCTIIENEQKISKMCNLRINFKSSIFPRNTALSTEKKQLKWMLVVVSEQQDQESGGGEGTLVIVKFVIQIDIFNFLLFPVACIHYSGDYSHHCFYRIKRKVKKIWYVCQVGLDSK